MAAHPIPSERSEKSHQFPHTGITPEQVAQLKRAIRQLVRAEVALSWIGSQPPADHEIIKMEHRSATSRVNLLIARLLRPAMRGNE